MIRYIRLYEGELAKLIRAAGPGGWHIDTSTGTNGVALRYDDDEETLPDAVLELARLRGVTVENCDGAGI